MAKQTINLGTAPNGAGGDDVRGGFTKCNSNFTELYNKAEEVDTLSTELDTLTTEVDTLSTELDTLTTEVDTLSTRVTPIELGGTGGATASSARQGLGLDERSDVTFGSITTTRGTYPTYKLNAFGVSNEFKWGLVELSPNGYITFISRKTSDDDKDGQIASSTPLQGGTLLSSNSTTVDSNGFIKKASPILKLSSTSTSTNDDPYFKSNTPTFTKQSTGVYTITNTHGLRLGDGWYIEQPKDRNGELYHNVEWEQDIEYKPEDGFIEESDPTVTLTIRTFERVWNKDTGLWENGNPVDIKEGRWIDLRLNEIKQPNPIIEEDEKENVLNV